jgi:raffinose/stachyose/melibiose transport system substrate-binding protein
MRRFRSVAVVGAAMAVAMTLVPSISASRKAETAGCTLHILGSTRANKAESDGWNKVFADFKAQYGCTVTATWSGQFTDVPRMLNEARLAHQTVNLVTTATTNKDLAKAGLLLDLTKLIKPYSGRFTPGATKLFNVGGHIWAIPVGAESSSVFFYNATLFKQLKLSEPKTYADLKKVAAKIKAAGVQPLVEAGKDTWEWPMWYMSTFAQRSGNKSVAAVQQILEGRSKFTRPDSVAAFGDIAQFAKDGLLNQTAFDTDENGAVAAFLQKKAAIMYDGTWVLPTLRAGNPSFKVGVFNFPLVVNRKGVVSQPSGAPEGALAIPSFAPKSDLQKTAQFLEFITRKQQATRVLAPLKPIVPSIKSVPSTTDPLAPELRKNRTIGWLDWIWPNEVNNAVIQAIQGVLFNNQSPQAAAQVVQSSLDTLKKQQNYTFNWWAKWSKADWAKVTPSPVPKIQVKG